MKTDSTIQINIYRSGGKWFGARWTGGEYDGCDELPCDGDASEADALACAMLMPMAADGVRSVTRVADANGGAS
jgi:hypothetical protein